MELPETITPLHVERSRQIRRVVSHDIANRSLTFEQAVESLAADLGIQIESVRLALAIANDQDSAVAIA